MDIGVISIRYARALLKAAIDANMEDAVYKEMTTLSKSYIEVPRLRLAIDNPMLPKNKKHELMITATGGHPSELTDRFMMLVLREGRENVLQFMANSYITLYRRHKNIIRGKLITAVAVSPETENKMRQMVEKKTRGIVEFESETNPDIIGGFVLEYDTFRLDASVQSQLRRVLAQMKK